MKKLKVLFAVLMALVSAGAWAQKDVTSNYITNATLADGTNGWTVYNFNAPQQGKNTVGYASEAYAGWGNLDVKSYYMTQKITLPKGKYRLVNYSFFRQGLNYDTEASKSLAKLKAGSNEVAIKTLGSITVGGYANNQADGANCFDSKMYRNTVDFDIDADGTEIEIGLVGDFDLKQSWCIAGMFELWDLEAEASESDPADMTYLITNPGFEYRNTTGWTSEGNGGGYANGDAFTPKAGIGFVEKWQGSNIGGLGDGSFYQEIMLPAGMYEVSVYASNVEQYNSDAAGTGMYLVANESKTQIGTADKYTAKTKVSTGKLNLGIKLDNATGNWIAFDRFELKYLGVDLDDLKLTLSSVISDAKELYTAKMNKDVLQALKDKVAEAELVEQKASAIKAITEQLQNAMAAANASIAIYAQIAALNTMVAENLDEAGQEAYATTTLVAYENCTLETYEEAYSGYIAAVKAQTTDNTDLTVTLVNPSFENGLTGWSKGAASLDLASQGNNSFAKVGSKYVEYWQPNGTLRAEQTVTGFHMGVYEVSVTALARGLKSAELYVNDVKVPMEIADKTTRYTASIAVDDDASLTLGFDAEGTGAGSSWFAADDVQLKLVSASLPSVTKAEGKMNKDVSAAQDEAIATYENHPSVATYNAALAAIAAAKASIAMYEQIAEINAKVATLDEDGQDAYAETLGKYNDGSLATLEEAQSAYLAAVRAQTTEGTDWSALGRTDQAGWTGATGLYSGCVEKYAGDNIAIPVGNALTQTITGLLPYAKYEVTFTAVANVARNLTEDDYGTGIAQVFANNTVKDIEVEKQGSCTPSDSKYQYTLETGADKDGNLIFGIKNIKAGGQWYVAQFTSLILTKLAANVTIGNSGLATFSSTEDCETPDGVEAYYATECNGTSVEMTKIEDGKIPANTGVVLKAEAGSFVLSYTTGAESISGNLLVANPSEELKLAPTADGNTNYVLSNGEFHPFTGLATVAAGKAYLSVPEAVGANALQLSFGVADGIESIESNVADDVMFNLAGQAVGNDFKGIVIKNGKKLLKK